MKVFVIIGRNDRLQNTSARAVYSRYEDAEAHISDPALMWFDDSAVIEVFEVDSQLRAKNQSDSTQ